MRDFNGRLLEVFLGVLGQAFDIEDSGLVKLNGKHEICFYFEGWWCTLWPKVSSIDPDNSIK